jgi:RimJ/RimL family protein N-acetyltransferase
VIHRLLLHVIAPWSRAGTIETARLTLRPPVPSDLEPYVKIHEHPDVQRHILTIGKQKGPAAGLRTLAILMHQWQVRGYGRWTVIEKATGEVIGSVGLWHPEGWPDVELGWVIRPSRWDNGFATEAAKAALNFALTTAGIDHVISPITADI